MSSYQIMKFKSGDLALKPYLGFIYSNWLHTLRDTNDWFKMIDREIYYKTYHAVITALLGRPATVVSIAVLSEDPDIGIGWSVSENETLHYCFVKRDARRLGIGRSLVPQGIKKLSHLTVPGAVIWKTKLNHMIFDPFF